jgi:two-component system, NtrC family, response regulator GlrR
MSDPFFDDTTEATPQALASVERFHLTVVDGPRRGLTWDSQGDRCGIGSHPSNELVIDEPTVSRFHCEILLEAKGARVRDLQSTNGTTVDGVTVLDAFLRSGSVLRIGNTGLRFESHGERVALPLSPSSEFGSLVGVSASMRATFALLERAATSSCTVLVEGETGTGKEDAAESIHKLSGRGGPFVVVDCGAIPPSLLESELFGHERGAFTGAHDRRIGAFEEAHGGTLFLDELGELPLELQPKLLRALESHEIRRVGSNQYRPVDVRVVAATNRDLRGAINGGTFRADLYFRLAVLRVPMPPLRTRPEDLPILVERLLLRLRAGDDEARALLTPAYFAQLQSAAWPGNVRELRNYLERCLVVKGPLPIGDGAAAASVGVDAQLPYGEARDRAAAEFERRYLEALLRSHNGQVARAAKAAGLDRAYLYRLLRRNGIKP